MTDKSIPRYIALESKWNHKFLGCKNEDEKMKGLLKFNEENVVNPRSKFEVERAKCDNKLIHIRCCYNNKYWVSWTNKDKKNQCVVATADEREEDRSKVSCTLFEPLFDTQHKAYRIRHVKRGFNVCIWKTTDNPFDGSLYCIVSTPDKDLCDLYSIINWESLVILPKHVAFKSKSNNDEYYLMGIWQDGHPYLQFSGKDNVEKVQNETFMARNGCVRIKSNYHGKFWRRDQNSIWADSDDDKSSKDPNSLFKAFRFDDKLVALQCMGNNKYLRRVNNEGKTECFVSTVTNDAKFKMEEPVKLRRINNVKYRVSDARVYEEKVMVMGTQNATNRTNKTETKSLTFTYKETKTSRWESSTTWKLAATTDLNAGLPFIEDGKIKVLETNSRTYEWGETFESIKTLETTHVVTVPPMSKVEVTLFSTKRCSDVPFSYDQHDVLTNGVKILHKFDDGIYTGIDFYKFDYKTKETRL